MKVRCLYDKLVPISELKLNPNNRNIHPKAQIERLAEILKYQGWRYCVKVSNQTGIATAGHGRVEAAIFNGWAEVPVNYQDYDTPDQEYADTIADNAIASWAELNVSGIQMDVKNLQTDFNVKFLGMENLSLGGAAVAEEQDHSEEDDSQSSDNNEGSSSEKEDIIPDKIEPRVKPNEVYRIGDHKVINGDCLAVLKTLASNSLDSLVTDPPAGISFMGKAWDDDKGGSKQWTAWLSSVMKEALRVLKPGAHGLVWAIPRTSHWTATALEDAGFEIRDVVTHIFGSGFPKSLAVDKAIDKMNGDERPVVSTHRVQDMRGNKYNAGLPSMDYNVTSAASAAWAGWGTALKPASEHWVLVRKPCEEDTVAANVLKYGTGGINIDASRIGQEERPKMMRTSTITGANSMSGVSTGSTNSGELTSQGRFPANLVLSHNPDCEDECTEGCAVALLDEQSGYLHGRQNKVTKESIDNGMFGNGIIRKNKSSVDSIDLDKGGGASRFFYVAKPSKTEKNAGCEELPEKKNDFQRDSSGLSSTTINGVRQKGNCGQANSNHHPTVKSTKLMQYLITMITPPDGVVLDCFGGSGTTLVAAHGKAFSSILIEQSPEYCDIILARAEYMTGKSAIKDHA